MIRTELTKLAIVGAGKIARDQHLASIAQNPAFMLTAAVNRNTTVEGGKNIICPPELLEDRPDIPALALCTPPQTRFELAWATLFMSQPVVSKGAEFEH